MGKDLGVEVEVVGKLGWVETLVGRVYIDGSCWQRYGSMRVCLFWGT